MRNLGIRIPLSKNPLLMDILLQRYTLNKIVNKFLLAGDKFMPEMHLSNQDLHSALVAILN